MNDIFSFEALSIKLEAPPQITLKEVEGLRIKRCSKVALKLTDKV